MPSQGRPPAPTMAAAPAAAAAAGLEPPAAAAAAAGLECDPVAELHKSSARVTQLEAELIAAKAQQTFWRKKVRQAELSALAARHGPVADVPSSQDAADVDVELEEAAAEVVAKAKVKAKGGAKGEAKAANRPREKRPTDGRCIACWNVSRGRFQGVAHNWGQGCTAKSKRAAKPEPQDEADKEEGKGEGEQKEREAK